METEVIKLILDEHSTRMNSMEQHQKESIAELKGEIKEFSEKLDINNNRLNSVETNVLRLSDKMEHMNGVIGEINAFNKGYEERIEKTIVETISRHEEKKKAKEMDVIKDDRHTLWMTALKKIVPIGVTMLFTALGCSKFL